MGERVTDPRECEGLSSEVGDLRLWETKVSGTLLYSGAFLTEWSPSPTPLAKDSLEVQVHPSRSVVPQGGPHSLRCQVNGSPPHYFYWSREDGRPLPSGAQQRHQGSHSPAASSVPGVSPVPTGHVELDPDEPLPTPGSELHFPSVQPSDAGVYICTCRNLQHTSNSRAELLVTGESLLPCPC